MLPVLLALAAPPALAHYPHDPALWVAVSPGPDPAWVVTSLWRNEAWMTARTANDRDVEVHYVMDGSRMTTSAELLAAERLVLGTEGLGLWTSEDAGRSWAVHPDIPPDADVDQVVAAPTVATGGVALACGTASVWRTADAGRSWGRVLVRPGVEVIDVDVAPPSAWATLPRACAVEEAGAVWCSDDAGATWAEAGSVADRPWKVSVDEKDRIWVGGEAGLWRSDDGGRTWSDAGFGGQDVTTVEALGGGVVLAATLLHAAWRTEDGGASWTLGSDDLEAPDTGQGGPRAGEHYLEFRASASGAVYLASWEGIARSDDGGRSWIRIHTETHEVTRGVALTRDGAGGLLLVVGAYGSGVVLGPALEPVAWPASTAVDLAYLRGVAVSPDWGAEGALVFTGRGDAFLTTDGAATWFQADPARVGGAVERAAVSPGWPEDRSIVLTAQVGPGADVVVSRDGGATWARGTLDAACTGYGSAVALSPGWVDDGRAWMPCLVDGTVFETRDHGATWMALDVLGSGTTAVAGAPGGSVVWAGAESGLWRYTPEQGAFAPAGFDGRRVTALALAPGFPDDPTMFVVAAEGSWWRSDDAGRTWRELPAPDDQLPLAVALSPDYAADGVVAVSGYGGAWVSADRGATWRQAHVLERHEESMPTWILRGGWERWEGEGLSGGRGTRSSTAGDTARFEARGVRVDLLSTPGGDGVLSVSLDGGDPAEVPLAGDPVDQSIVWTSGRLDDAWHVLDLAVVEGTVRLDAAQVWRQLPGGGDTGPDDTDPDTPGAPGRPGSRCPGCDGAGGGAGGLAWLLAALVARRRRGRRGSGPTEIRATTRRGTCP